MPPLPPIAAPALPLRRFTVDEYHRMIDLRILREGEPVELLEGWIAYMPEYVPRELLGKGAKARLRRFTVAEYQRMIRNGIIREGERCELLEGWVVEKMSRNPPHDLVLGLVEDAVGSRLPAGWFRRDQSAVTTSDSEPEPDVGVVRGKRRDFGRRHPGPADMGLVIEVSESSLDQDRTEKQRIYARASIPVYWIVNIVEEQVEVYTDPTGDCDEPCYRSRRDYHRDEEVPLVLDGVEVARIPVRDVLP
jgi:Uma2 family endonuclease